MLGLKKYAVLVLIMVSGSAGAEQGGLTQAARIAEDALAHGYGGMCDLSAMPTVSDGYYRCVDIGPYRFIRAYAADGWRLQGYLVAGGEPFRFMEYAAGRLNVLIKGPWEEDLLTRAMKFADDNSGLNAERSRLAEPEGKRIEAERRLKEFQEIDAKQGTKGASTDQQVTQK